jgi:hypothetical protein
MKLTEQNTPLVDPSQDLKKEDILPNTEEKLKSTPGTGSDFVYIYWQ